MARTISPEQPHNPTFRTIDMGAEAKRIWGAKWSAPERSYVFSNGREFELRTEDASIYASSPDF